MADRAHSTRRDFLRAIPAGVALASLPALAHAAPATGIELTDQFAGLLAAWRDADQDYRALPGAGGTIGFNHSSDEGVALHDAWIIRQRAASAMLEILRSVTC